MERQNPYDNETLDWLPYMGQQQIQQSRTFSRQERSNERMSSERSAQKVFPMPKAQALSLVSSLKKITIIGSIGFFGLLGTVIAGSSMVQNVASQQPVDQPGNTGPAIQGPSQSGGFFQHHRHHDADNAGGGYDFGNGGSGSNSVPHSGTGVS